MLILSMRTDKPVSEIGLYDDDQQIAYVEWEAHRQLAETIHLKLQDILKGNKAGLSALQGIVIYRGPGSFTGLRIGMSVANALADSLKIPIIATNKKSWQKSGIAKIIKGENEFPVTPEYGGQVLTTKPVK